MIGGSVARIRELEKISRAVGPISSSRYIEETARAGVGQGFKCGDPIPGGHWQDGRHARFHLLLSDAKSGKRLSLGGIAKIPILIRPPLAGKSDYAGNIGGEYAFMGIEFRL